MPDITPPATTTNEAPSQGAGGWRPDLGALRARLDEIDDKIHDLLIDRAGVVESVARSGKTAAFRPGREASMLRRLLGRHTGMLPPRTIVRMWREMLAGTTAMQAPVSVAVFDPTGSVAAIAREHFGFLTPTIEHPSVEQALAAVRDGSVAVAVLPFPAGDQAWWAALTSGPRLHVVARLPFWTARAAHVPAADALAVAASAPDASGLDRSFIALTAAPDRARLAGAGLTLLATHGTVAEVDGAVASGDPRLPAGAVALGFYAVPVAGDPP